MKIKQKFLELTKKTYPHGTEDQLLSLLPSGYKEDGFGNYFIQIGNSPSTMFTCHLDTASQREEGVNHVFDGKFIKTDGKTILGADDKAGMTILLYMIEKNVEGLYYFFIGEERGCVGSRLASSNWSSFDFSSYITKCISFDRRGTSSVITEQLYGVCCSLEFAKELSKRLNEKNSEFNFSPDPTGIYTDSAQFTSLIPECTNISVGYYNEHSGSESQDIEFLEKLCKVCIEVDWETLPIVKNPGEYIVGYDDEDDEDFGLFGSDYSGFSPDNFVYVNHDGETKKMMISDEYIESEKEIISNWMKSSGIDQDVFDITWDGQMLYGASFSGSYDFIANREDIMGHVEELRSIPSEHLKLIS
jgi:hypothetical protein